MAKDGIDVFVVSPGLTQTNFSQNMLEQKAKIQLDHLRGMTSEQVAIATLCAIEKGKLDVTLTLKGKLLVLVNRFFPWFVDWKAKKTVRKLFADEIAERKERRSRPPTDSMNRLLEHDVWLDLVERLGAESLDLAEISQRGRASRLSR